MKKIILLFLLALACTVTLHAQKKTSEKISAEEYHTKGLNAQKNGFNELAIEYYQKAVALDPNDTTAYYNMGDAHYYLQNYHEAIRCHKKAVANASGWEYLNILSFLPYMCLVVGTIALIISIIMLIISWIRYKSAVNKIFHERDNKKIDDILAKKDEAKKLANVGASLLSFGVVFIILGIIMLLTLN